MCGRKGGLRGLGAERLKKLVEGVVDLAQSHFKHAASLHRWHYAIC